MTIEQILEIVEKYKLRMPPTAFYELKADIVNFEEPTTKNDLGVDCISRKAALDITWHDPSYSDPLNVLTEVRDKIRNLPSVTPQEPKTGHWIPTYGNVKCSVCGSIKDSREVGKATHYCDFCGCRMVEPQESEGNNGKTI